MAKKESSQFRRAGGPPDIATLPFARTVLGRVVLCFCTVAALSLSFAPFKQFYLAWVGLVPWLLLVANARSGKGAFFLSWVTGICVFSVCMWWIGYVTVPGAMGLMLYMGLWFGIAAVVLRGAGLLRIEEAGKLVPWWRPVVTVFLIAGVWVGTEWTWGNWFMGLPWLFVGHAQTPVLAMCQVADFAGVYGVSFWVVLVNAWVALLILHRLDFRRVLVAGVVVLGVLGAVLGYGLFRMGQATFSPGPRVMVVQPNYPQDNSGAKGASYDEILAFHAQATQAAIKELAGRNEKPDLVAWLETMLPELNVAYRAYMQGFYRQSDKMNMGDWLDSVYKQASELAAKDGVNLVTGGHAMEPERPKEDKAQWSRRNASYLFDREGHEAKRYDKIHLVPFGEFMPFRESCPPLYRIFDVFNPYKGKDYTVASGRELTVFTISDGGGRPYRFVTPICFEDVDSTLVAGMFAGENGTKRADFIVNLTNDGWFATPQMQQHLQLSIFRCIENRVPTARSVNTGISGFIDSVGRVHDALPIHITGTATARLELDSRIAPFTHLGDLFGRICVGLGAAMVGVGVWNGMKNRKLRGR